MYVEHWRKLACTTFLGNFPIHLAQFCGTFMNSSLLEYAIGFESKISFNWLFGFLFSFRYAILLSQMKSFSQPLCQSLVSPRHYFTYLLSWEVCTNLQIKRFPSFGSFHLFYLLKGHMKLNGQK